MISVRCVARDLHTIAPGSHERTCWRQFAALWGDWKKSQIASLNAIIIIIIIINIIIIIIIIIKKEKSERTTSVAEEGENETVVC